MLTSARLQSETISILITSFLWLLDLLVCTYSTWRRLFLDASLTQKRRNTLLPPTAAKSYPRATQKPTQRIAVRLCDYANINARRASDLTPDARTPLRCF